MGAQTQKDSEKYCVRSDGRNLVEEWMNYKDAQGETRAYVTTTGELHSLDVENTEYIMGEL